MLDEMDLLSDLKAAESVRPSAYDEARAVLRAAMAVEGAPAMTTAPGRRPRWGTRRTAGVSIAALGAAAAAVALVVTSAAAPSRNAAASGQPSAKTTPAAANPVLAQLAADITTTRQARLPGDATLEIRNQSPASDQPGGNGIDVYTDNGTYYWGYSKSDLLRVIAQHQDVGEGQFKRAMAAALIAAKGDIATARARMAIANLIPGTKPFRGARRTEIEKLKAVDKERGIKYTPPRPLTPEQRQEQTDNFTWMNSLDALTAAPENARVRAGVLAIMATMPNVRVTHTTTAGQPTLTLADSWPRLSGRLVESLVINASTGTPVALFNRNPGQPLNATYYHTFRVTLAHIKTGQF
jgi:hypothetical protein